MLIRFAVENFLSFKDRAEFSMMAGKITRHGDHIALCSHKRVLKGAFLFGANAGGKTNFIRAAAFAKNIVTNGIANTNFDKKYYRIDPAYREKPGVFQFDLYFNGHFYSYGFAVSYLTASIEEEWLYLIDDKESCVFLRSKTDEGTFFVDSDIRFKNENQQDRFNIYADDISNPKMKQTLFLSDIAMRSPDNEIEYQPFRDVREWFERLIIIFPDSKFGGITQLLENDDERTRLETLLNYFDTGIESVSKKEIEFDKVFSMLPEDILDSLKTDLMKNLREADKGALVQQDTSLVEIRNVNGNLLASEVVSDHGNSKDLFEYRDESDGTQRLFDLIPLYQRLLMGAVVFVDELDRSLHTKAVQEFIKYFYDLTKDNASQLIATTHDANVMDLDLLRQDEIWFIERQEDHSSRMYSLNEYKTRFDKKVVKDYLLGRYGALPVFKQAALWRDDEEKGDENEEALQ